MTVSTTEAPTTAPAIPSAVTVNSRLSRTSELPRLAVDRAHDSVPFLKLIEPLMARAYDGLVADLAELDDGSEMPFDEGAAEILFENVPGRLAMLLRRTLVLELNVVRLGGELAGESPEERFKSFVERLERPEIRRQILSEYPVLNDMVQRRLAQWGEASLEFARRLRDNWAEICRLFWPGSAPPERLVEAKTGLGDSHRGGRSVITLRFACGRRLVYKPRSLEVERRFNDLLRYVNDKGFEPALRTLTVLERDDYGWVEFVESKPCDDRAAVRRFYERQGGFLALLYLLNASDFHFENIIASGEHPVLVDLETLFNPRLTDGHGTREPVKLGEILRRSVLGPGLLPNRFRSNPEKKEGVDLSGLSPVAGQETWKPVLAIEDAGTDEMRFAYRPGTFPGTQHHPALEGAEVDEISAADHIEEICTGFERCYRVLLRNKQELESEAGPIRAFAATEVRMIFRATLSYALLLSECCHPDLLRDADDRERLFDRLEHTIADQPHMARMIAAERHDLRQVDVPIFTTLPSSLDVWTSRGERLENVFAESGLSMVERSVARLGEDDLERQSWLVRATLGTLAHSRGSRLASVPASTPANAAPPPREARTEELLRGADAVAERLKRMAWRENGEASWYTFNFLSGRHWNVQPAPPDLYDGLAGIAFFLAYHGYVRADAASTEIAHHAVATLRGDLEASPDLLPMIGALNGWGGLIHLYVHLAELWSEPRWLDEAEIIVAGLGKRIDEERHYDVVAGSAGCLAALLELYERRPSEATLAAAVRCGEHLLSGARLLAASDSGTGYGWLVEEAGATPLAGFSHGAAGIAWALFRLAALTGDVRARRAALGAIAYERSVFSSVEQNWPDLRAGSRPEEAGGPGAGGHHFLTAWCHGAPGVVLGRLLSRLHFEDDQSRREIVVGLETLRRTGFGKSDCLCHGSLGNLDVMLVASEVLNDASLRLETYRRASFLLARAAERGWRYGVPDGMEPPGLFTGLAGFGYQLLRLAHPERVPSILALASPRT